MFYHTHTDAIHRVLNRASDTLRIGTYFGTSHLREADGETIFTNKNENFPDRCFPGQTVLPTQANSSQVTKSKLASAGGQTIPPSRASLQETIQLSECDTITKQLGSSWLEFADVDNRWKTWLELGETLSLIKFKLTRANSSQLDGRTIQLQRSCELGSS